MIDKKEEKTPFTLTPEELSNPKFRRGFPGRYTSTNPKRWDADAPNPHSNFKEGLCSFYRAGRFVAIRGDLMAAINATLPPRKLRKVKEVEEVLD